MLQPTREFPKSGCIENDLIATRYHSFVKKPPVLKNQVSIAGKLHCLFARWNAALTLQVIYIAIAIANSYPCKVRTNPAADKDKQCNHLQLKHLHLFRAMYIILETSFILKSENSDHKSSLFQEIHTIELHIHLRLVAYHSRRQNRL
jgi:hypothetical protein